MEFAALSLTPDDTSSDAKPGSDASAERRRMDQFLADVERRAFRVALLAVRDADDALDIVQDAMIRLVRSYSRRPTSEWAPLFYRILQNRIRDHQRRLTVRRKVFGWLDRSRLPEDGYADPITQAPERYQEEPEHQAAVGRTLRTLESAVAALPSRQREAFLLRSVEGLNVADTASAMGCSAGSVKTHYSRAVHSLREALGEHWP